MLLWQDNQPRFHQTVEDNYVLEISTDIKKEFKKFQFTRKNIFYCS